MNWIRETFSENGVMSCKRVAGFIGWLIAQVCILLLCILNGPVTIVENLLEYDLVISSALIGLHSVTSIFKKNEHKEAQ